MYGPFPKVTAAFTEYSDSMSVPDSEPASKCSACGTSFTPRIDLESDTIRERLLSDYDPGAREEIEATISLVEEDYRNCATEIERLHLRQQQLKLCGLKLQSHLSPSPIRKLPNEVLMYAFDYVSQDNLFLEKRALSFSDLWPGDEKGLTSMPALVLSSVCSRWRRITLSYSALWSRMSVIVDMKSPDSEFSRLITTLQLYIDRSGTSLLRLRIDTSTQYYQVTHFALSLLGQHSRRWQHLTFIGTNYLSREIFSLPIDVHNFPVLKELEFDSTTAEPLDIFRHAPKLRSLVVQSGDTDTYSLNTVFPWRQLTSLDIPCDEELWSVLDRCPDLVSLQLSFWDIDDIVPPDVPAVFRSLKSLSVVIIDNDIESLDDLMTSLVCPSLTSLMMERQIGRADSISEVTWPLKKLESFLSLSSCALTSLSFKGFELSSSELINVLKLLLSLASLVVEDLCDGERKSVIPFFVQHLHSLRSSTLRLSSDPPLLPKLRHLSLTYAGTRFNDAVFVDVIKSRCLPIVDAKKRRIDPLRSLVLKSLHRTLDKGVAEIYEPLRKLEDAGFRLVVIFQGQGRSDIVV